MKSVIEAIFKGLAVVFDSVPILNKFKGWRTVIGLLGLTVIGVLQQTGIVYGHADIINPLWYGFIGLTGLALNAKNNT